MGDEINEFPKPESAGQLFVGTETDFPFADGRWEFIRFRDLGVAGPSNGLMRAEIVSRKSNVQFESSWHFHPAPCIGQFFYVLKGWCDFEFDDGSLHHVREGTSGFIPGGMRHSALRMSGDYTAIEISFPADTTTVRCDRPSPTCVESF